jgi:molybdenum cofactor guanylyltransferase
MRLGSIVLCGGRSTRMGTPKAWLTLDGETMLQRIVRIVPKPVVVVAAEGQSIPHINATLVRDANPDRGPLEGLFAGLSACDVDVVFVAACDLPNITSALIHRLVEQLGDADACVPMIDGHPQPLAAVYRTRITPIVTSLLAADRRAMRDLLAAIRFVPYDASALRHEFQNINTPDAYATLRDSLS